MIEVERQYWLWVTRPDYYLDEDGNDSEDLDPDSGVDSDGWWTCHKDTKKGDLVLLWRTSPKKDIGYLIQAESDAYSIADDNEHGWEYGCDYQMLYKFRNPINIVDIRNEPYLDEWGAVRCNFQRRSFEIAKNYWDKLNQLAISKNTGYKDFIEHILRESISEERLLEEQLEEMLATNLHVLKNFGHDLKLYIDPVSKQSGRQFICRGNGGRIDLLCYDKIKNRYVVIELKIVRAGQNTFGQISNYVGWVQNRIAGDVPVVGIVISRGYDTKFESARKITDKITQINVEELGFSIATPKKRWKSTEPTQEQSNKCTPKLGIRAAKSREANKWLNQGNMLFDQAKYAEAVTCYDKVIETSPKNKWGWINKGAALEEMGKHDEAIKIFDKAIEINPQSADLWCGKGNVLSYQDKFEDAIIAFDKAIDIKPKHADAWNGRGMVLGNMEKHNEAIHAYDKATTIRPKFDVAWNNKGIALSNLSKYNDAIKAYDRAIELNPKAASFWSNKGTAFYGLSNFEKALEAFNKAIDIDPEVALHWYFKSEALKALKQIEEANSALAKAKELGYDD